MRWLSEIRNDVRSKRVSSSLSGELCFYLGKFKDSRAHYENAVCLRDPVHRTFVPSPAHGQAWILSHFYNTLVCLGYADQARFRRDEAMAQARRHSPYTLASTLCVSWLGDWVIEGAQSPQTMLRSANEVLAISREQGFPLWLGFGNVMRGWWGLLKSQPDPRQKTPQISPIFKADTVRLQVSREKDRKLHLVDAGWAIRRSFSRTAAGKLAEGWRGETYPPQGER
jgi:hypothetical protein